MEVLRLQISSLIEDFPRGFLDIAASLPSGCWTTSGPAARTASSRWKRSELTVRGAPR